MTTRPAPRIPVLVAGCAILLLTGNVMPAAAEESPSPLHEDAGRDAKLRERLPGAKTLRLVKVVRWPERTPGPCTADFGVEKDESRIDVSYRIDGRQQKLDSVGFSRLAKEGWLAAYRTPAGVGIEKTADFESIDLTARETLVCKCFDGERERSTHAVVLRLRWSAGEIPAVSAGVDRGGKLDGMKPAITVGRLVTYEFPVAEAFPGDRAGTCGGKIQLTLLIDPPML
jgi:hypothetical protein